jgi:RNA polymerase sigma-70 factor, ECF subfamily
VELTEERTMGGAVAVAVPAARRTPLPADGLTPLVDAARDGSVAAFERLYRSMAAQVASYLRWHRVSDPEGLTNDVFAQVHRKLGSFEGDEQGFRSWVFTIAHHRMIDDRRRSGRQPTVDGDVDVEDHRATGDVEDDAFAVLGSDRVRDLLSILSEDQRNVVLLRVVGDQSVEDVARILGKREGAIKALQHRAMAALRRHLARQPVSA